MVPIWRRRSASRGKAQVALIELRARRGPTACRTLHLTEAQVLLGSEAGKDARVLRHQPDLARRFADRIILLDAGRIVFDGTPAKFDGDITRPRLLAVGQ